MRTQLAVLGGGPGGYSAAFLAADLGVQTTLVEARPTLGGVCLLEGCIPSKALLHVARVLAEAQEVREWGVQFAKPRIDLDALRAHKDKVISTLTGGLAEVAKARGVRVVRARGRLGDGRTLLLEPAGDDGPVEDRVEFEHLILATGARPIVPKAMALPGGRVMSSSESLSLPDVPQRLLVIGGGYIGLEMGIIYARLGSKVTVVEMLDSLLSGVDEDLVRPLRKMLDGLFADIRTGTKVISVSRAGRGGAKVRVEMEQEGKADTEEFDRVLVAVGRRPNTEDLGLDAAGVELDDHGQVIVAPTRRSSNERIYAIGDITGPPQLAHKAFHEGFAAAEAIAGGPGAYQKLALPAVVFTDPEIAWAGLTEREARAAGREVAVATYPWAANGRARSLGRAEGLTKMLFDPRTDRVLGVGMVGVSAGDLIAEAALAIETGCTARDLVDTVHPHPTLSETLAGAAAVRLGIATEVHRPRRS